MNIIPDFDVRKSRISKQNFEIGKAGTVFEGTSQVNLTMDELLKKEAAF